MSEQNQHNVSAFYGERRLARGHIADVALSLKRELSERELASVMVYSDQSSQLVEIDFRGSEEEVLARLPARQGGGAAAPVETGRAREITLPAHLWAWLDGQPGGAGTTLRRLAEEAEGRQQSRTESRRRACDAIQNSMSALAKKLPGFEQAEAALRAGERRILKPPSSPGPRACAPTCRS
ncbi:DUF2239 family protein [Microbulbifer taiwanensis]|uniref:DUF2239 family protein n=1 Tax=Microbulbifer taiwanensis TaxID=986746 RepID=UPI003617848F